MDVWRLLKESLLVQAPVEIETPEWGNNIPAASGNESSSSDGTEKDRGAAPKSWKGLGEWQVPT